MPNEKIKLTKELIEMGVIFEVPFSFTNIWKLVPNSLDTGRYIKAVINHVVGYLDQEEENPIEGAILYEQIEDDLELAALKLLRDVKKGKGNA